MSLIVLTKPDAGNEVGDGGSAAEVIADGATVAESSCAVGVDGLAESVGSPDGPALGAGADSPARAAGLLVVPLDDVDVDAGGVTVQPTRAIIATTPATTRKYVR